MLDFLAFYEDFVGNMKANRELENLDWISLNEAKNKKIADVTEFMLNEIIKLNNNYSNVSNKKVFRCLLGKIISAGLSGIR